MFERYCRLLHINRSRRLFSQLKQQRSYLAERERLKKSEHKLYLELSEQNSLNKKLYLEIQQLNQKIIENEERLNINVNELLNVCAFLKGLVDNVKKYLNLKNSSNSFVFKFFKN